jgi:hypothetical protein
MAWPDTSAQPAAASAVVRRVQAAKGSRRLPFADIARNELNSG